MYSTSGVATGKTVEEGRVDRPTVDGGVDFFLFKVNEIYPVAPGGGGEASFPQLVICIATDAETSPRLQIALGYVSRVLWWSPPTYPGSLCETPQSNIYKGPRLDMPAG